MAEVAAHTINGLMPREVGARLVLYPVWAAKGVSMYSAKEDKAVGPEAESPREVVFPAPLHWLERPLKALPPAKHCEHFRFLWRVSESGENENRERVLDSINAHDTVTDLKETRCGPLRIDGAYAGGCGAEPDPLFAPGRWRRERERDALPSVEKVKGGAEPARSVDLKL